MATAKPKFPTLAAKPGFIAGANKNVIGRIAGPHARGLFPLEPVGEKVKGGEIRLAIDSPLLTGLYLVRTYANPGGWKETIYAAAWNAEAEAMACSTMAVADAKLAAIAIEKHTDPGAVLYWDNGLQTVTFAENGNAVELARESLNLADEPTTAELEPEPEADFPVGAAPGDNAPEPADAEHSEDFPPVEMPVLDDTTALRPVTVAEALGTSEPTAFPAADDAMEAIEATTAIVEAITGQPTPTAKPKRGRAAKPKPAPSAVAEDVAKLMAHDAVSVRTTLVPGSADPVGAIGELCEIRGTAQHVRDAVMVAASALANLNAEELADARSILRQLQPRAEGAPAITLPAVPKTNVVQITEEPELTDAGEPYAANVTVEVPPIDVGELEPVGMEYNGEVSPADAIEYEPPQDEYQPPAEVTGEPEM